MSIFINITDRQTKKHIKSIVWNLTIQLLSIIELKTIASECSKSFMKILEKFRMVSNVAKVLRVLENFSK